MELVIERSTGADDAVVVHLTLTSADEAPDAEDAVMLAVNAGADASVWIHGATPVRDEMMRGLGYRSDRTLLQLRRDLPADRSDLVTRPFREFDIDALVAVNNRAFAWHPEQGDMTPESLRATMAESWFTAAGLRVLELDDRLAGFCWTKIHDQPERLGEIYVIGLDPDYTGRGLGGPLTLAGLDWLHDAGLTTAMLYVEADNEPARSVYDRLGFTTHRTDRLWHR